jgi:hypothetical protein
MLYADLEMLEARAFSVHLDHRSRTPLQQTFPLKVRKAFGILRGGFWLSLFDNSTSERSGMQRNASLLKTPATADFSSRAAAGL